MGTEAALFYDGGDIAETCARSWHLDMTPSRFANLTALADAHRTDKGSVDGDRHLYTELYAAAFEAIRFQEFCLLELGLLRYVDRAEEIDPENRPTDRVPSIDMWLGFFPNATCYGFDSGDFSALEKPRFKFIRGDLSNDADIDRLAKSISAPRIIIDDASHASFHQQRAFRRLFPLLEPGGFYAIEDLHYSPPFELSLPSCRPMWKVVEEYLETGSLTLDFASATDAKLIADDIAHSFVHCSSRGSPHFGPKLVIFQKRPDARPSSIPARPPATEVPVVDREWLTTRMFSFRGAHSKAVYTSTLRFDQSGLISGYRNRNETSWRLDRGRLKILRDDGVPSCVADPIRNDDGTISFVGKFLFSNSGTLHRFDENPVDPATPAVVSFDLFDTLVARRCYDPIEIFKIVELKSGIAGFAQVRQDEERRLWQAGDYGLDDIYALLAAASGWPDRILERLRLLELAVEWDNLMPIREMVVRVRPDDLVVSDMYLPLKFLRSVLQIKCSIDNPTLHLSSHGKHRGEIWNTIRSTHRIVLHYGDNLHSDVQSAQRANLKVEHVTTSRWSRGEKVLIDAGLGSFATVIREARLVSFDGDVAIRTAELAQLEINIPLLIVAGLFILKQAQEHEIDTLLMCSRDCNLWVSLMRWMSSRSPAAPHVRYLITSRILLLADSSDYRAYVSQMRGARNLLVDVSGTGRSPSYFLRNFDDHLNASVFLVAGSDVVGNFVNTLAEHTEDVKIEVLSEQSHEKRLAIESLNMSLEGRAHEIAFSGHDFEVLFQPNEFGHSARRSILAMQRKFAEVMALLERDGMRRLPEGVSVEALRGAADTLIGRVGEFRAAYAAILRDINQEEGNIARMALAARKRNLADTGEAQRQ